MKQSRAADVTLADILYRIFLGREIDSAAREAIASQLRKERSPPLQLAVELLNSGECLGNMTVLAKEIHLNMIHGASIKMIKSLVPQADTILDLGGANSPLGHTEYIHPFRKMVLVDLPPADRHEMYKDLKVDSAHGDPRVAIHYGDSAI